MNRQEIFKISKYGKLNLKNSVILFVDSNSSVNPDSEIYWVTSLIVAVLCKMADGFFTACDGLCHRPGLHITNYSPIPVA
jgi:hypothetical protein